MVAALQKFFTCLIAVLIAIMLFRYWRIGEVIFSGRFDEINHLRTVALVVAYFGLNIAAIVGLLQLTAWRTVVTCVAIIFSTIFFSTEYVPYIIGFFERVYRPYIMIISNLVIMFCVILLHKQRNKR